MNRVRYVFMYDYVNIRNNNILKSKNYVTVYNIHFYK